MELWDVYDCEGNKTGKKIYRENRDDILLEGEYFMVTHIIIRNSKNEFLLQKRSIDKEIMPGEWDITGGAIISGEDKLAGAMREVKEELGINLKKKELKHIARLRRSNHFIDIWDVLKDIDLDKCILQESEVEEVMYVSSGQLFDIFLGNKNYDKEYRDIIMDYYKAKQIDIELLI